RRHAEAFEGIAAHGLVAAGAEEKRARDALARLGDHASRLAAQQEVAAAAVGQEERDAGKQAQELLRREVGRRAADLERAEVAQARKDEVVGAAEVAAM